MCLYIQSGPHVAERNIPVYKSLTHSNESRARHFVYEPNTLYPSVNLERVIPSRMSRGAIHKGYHAWSYQHTYVKRALLAAAGPLRRFFWIKKTYGDGYTGWGVGETIDKLVAFTIPKGATYYIGSDGDIVASQIKSGSLKPMRVRDINRRNRYVP